MKNLILILISVIALFSCEKDEDIPYQDKGMNIQVGVFNGQSIISDSVTTTLTDNVSLTIAKDIANNYYIIDVQGRTYYPKLIEINNDLAVSQKKEGINLFDDEREITFKINNGGEYFYFKGARN